MNCQKGDIAVIVGCKKAAHRKYIGSMLRITDVAIERSAYEGDLYWFFEPLSPILIAVGVTTVRDFFLRPVRDPGDNATDETLDWLPVPTEVTA